MQNLGAEWDRLMRCGDYAGAWRISDVLLADRPTSFFDDPTLPYHLRTVWDGRPFQGRHVLVRCYHGLGDTLQFSRYLPFLRRSVASLAVEVQPELVQLLSTLDCIDTIIPFSQDSPADQSECDIEIMELPYALRLPPDDISQPYLFSPTTMFPGAGVGLCWQAGQWDPDRSVPSHLFEIFTSHPCVTLSPKPTELNVINRDGCPPDINATAAIVAGLDLVITVDTMMAHLAGALGRPTWLLLKKNADWRWMTSRRDTPWYSTMQLYRQHTQGDWPSVMAAVVDDWQRYLERRKDT